MLHHVLRQKEAKLPRYSWGHLWDIAATVGPQTFEADGVQKIESEAASSSSCALLPISDRIVQALQDDVEAPEREALAKRERERDDKDIRESFAHNHKARHWQ